MLTEQRFKELFEHHFPLFRGLPEHLAEGRPLSEFSPHRPGAKRAETESEVKQVLDVVQNVRDAGGRISFEQAEERLFGDSQSGSVNFAAAHPNYPGGKPDAGPGSGMREYTSAPPPPPEGRSLAAERDETAFRIGQLDYELSKSAERSGRPPDAILRQLAEEHRQACSEAARAGRSVLRMDPSPLEIEFSTRITSAPAFAGKRPSFDQALSSLRSLYENVRIEGSPIH